MGRLSVFEYQQMASRACRTVSGRLVRSAGRRDAFFVATRQVHSTTNIRTTSPFCGITPLCTCTATAVLPLPPAVDRRYSSTYATARASALEKTYSVANVSADGRLSVTTLALPDILRNSSLHARDLFSLALTSSHEVEDTLRKSRRATGAAARTPAAILPRGDEIVLSFGSIRALIGRDRGMIFDAHAPGTQLLAAEIANVYELRTLEGRENRWRKMAGFKDRQEEHTRTDHGLDWSAKMRYEGEPFELVFIEEILRDTCDTFNRRLRLYEPIVDTLLTRVHNEVFSDSGVQHLVPIKDSLQEFELNVENCLECLTHLLDNDEDMLGLLLTEQHVASARGEDLHHEHHERVELLFEEYARQLNNIIHEIHFLLKRIQSKQELVAISLDSYRNRMIRMNVMLAVAGVGLATSTTVAGYFGMNLISGFEESPTAFTTTVVSSSAVTLAIFAGCSSYLSGSRMKQRAIERIEEIETITGALSDMQSLDYAIKTMLNENKPMNKAEFKEKLSECRPSGTVNEDEINLLFHILDLSRDGYIYTSDFRSIESFQAPEHIRVALRSKQKSQGSSELDSKNKK
mmetsp:Transcript_36645/g.80157  ORF Transcript_36645/g.80157 Transcript_36645/m.80157 type:complete len:576 (+) Transcript_36645:469-2196(+)